MLLFSYSLFVLSSKFILGQTNGLSKFKIIIYVHLLPSIYVASNYFCPWDFDFNSSQAKLITVIMDCDAVVQVSMTIDWYH